MGMSISWGITVNDELEEFKRLIDLLTTHVGELDEIVVQQDSRDGDELGFSNNEVHDYCKSLGDSITYIQFPLNGDFASFKNNLLEHCTKDYLFQIDADELVSIDLIRTLSSILESNPDVDMYAVPRINTVDGLTKEYADKWGWQINDKNQINRPDYQMRILKLGQGIYWKNKVHEVLTGFSQYAALPDEDEYCLYHPKTLEKQIKQNNHYETIS